VTNARKTFVRKNDGPLEVLAGINLEIHQREFVAILGPSGCGKTTLLNALAGQEVLDSGSIAYSFADNGCASPNIAVAWQDGSLMPWKTVHGNIEFPLIIKGVERGERKKRVADWINLIGLRGFESSYPAQLSQGMARRVSLAAALVTAPSLLLMDEPFSALDPYTKRQIEKEVVKLWESIDSTIILVTHDTQEAIALADRIVVLTERPARVKRIVTNPLPRPRDLDALYAQKEFHDLVRDLWVELMEGKE
jgi:NitT/TauT family transport system ATP-binding protein